MAKANWPKPNWFDKLVYRLYRWRWNRIFANRPDLREMFISWMKTYDMVNEGQDVEVTVSIRPVTKSTHE